MERKRIRLMGFPVGLTMVIIVFIGLFMMNIFYPLYAYGSEVPEKRRPKLDVPYEPTSYEIAREMLNLAEIKKGDIVYDLGCGDGRLVIMAAKDRGAKGIGVDLDPQRIRESIENAKREKVLDQVEFYVKDLFKTDIRRADVILLYLWPEVNLKLRPKLLKELRPGTRVVSHSHSMGDWEADGMKEVANHRIYLWYIPADVKGLWELNIPYKNEDNRFMVRFNQLYQKVTTDASGIRDITLKGNELRFTLDLSSEGKRKKGICEGHVVGDLISGKMELYGEGPLKEVSSWNGRRIKR
ncbi:MAG: 50S ribosomal protein L11 methyltransferase [Syntrophorhabdaceae bacterium]|nr:50S ribosomal protein L11 methyltransferase [Syntrophorhabdaceae bacterium]